MRIFKIKRVLERLQSLKAALERSVRTPVIIALYQECSLCLNLLISRHRKSCCTVSSSGEKIGRGQCLL